MSPSPFNYLHIQLDFNPLIIGVQYLIAVALLALCTILVVEVTCMWWIFSVDLLVPYNVA